MRKIWVFLISGCLIVLVVWIRVNRSPNVSRAESGKAKSEAVQGFTKLEAIRQALQICGVNAERDQILSLLRNPNDKSVAAALGVDLILPTGGDLDLPVVIPTRDDKAIVVTAREPESGRLLVMTGAGRHEWADPQRYATWPSTSLSFRKSAIPEPGPRIWLAEQTVWLGTRELGTTHLHQVPFVNTGDSPLTILGTFASCPCTKVKAIPTLLEPGEAGQLYLAVETKELTAKAFRVDITVRSDSSTGEITSLPVTAALTRPTGFDQRKFVLGNLPPTQTRVELQSEFHCPGCGSVEIEPVYLDRGIQWGRVAAGQEDKTKVYFSVDLTDVQADAEGQFECHLFLRPTTNRPARVHEFVVKGKKLPWIQSTPATIFAGRLEPGQKQRFSTRLQSFAPGGVQIHHPVPELVHAEFVGPSTVTFEVTAPSVGGMFRTTVMVSQGARSLNIPIVGVVNSAVSTVPAAVDKTEGPDVPAEEKPAEEFTSPTAAIQ